MSNRLEDIIAIVARFPEGATLEEIEGQLNPPVPRRTLQYWLSLLSEQGSIVVSGTAVTQRYRLAKRPNRQV
jgi:hypothetical protein